MTKRKLVLTILLLCAVFRMIAQPPPPPAPPPPPPPGGCTPSVTASSSSIIPCGSITFTAVPSNSSSNPAYFWYKNNIQVGSSATYVSASNSANDSIWVTMTDDPCSTGTPVTLTSNKIILNGSSNAVASVNISANTTNLNLGQLIQLTASPSNAGVSTTYTWYMNGAPVGQQHYATLTYGGALGNGDQIYATMNTYVCGVSQTVTSNTVTFTKSGSSAKDITLLTMPNQIGTSVINTTTATVTAVVPAGPRNSMHPVRFYISAGATYGPAAYINQDFTGPVTYAVRAQDGSHKIWTVIVTDPSGNRTASKTNETDNTEAATSEELNVQTAELAIYPNPAQTYINLNVAGGTEPTVITLLDMMGRVMYNQQLPATDVVNHLVDVSQFPVGTYIAYVATGDKKQTKQFIVTK